MVHDVNRIDIIIPLFNKARYIERTLASVFEQTYDNYRVIVVDDGSTDSGDEIVENLDDSRITLIRQSNRGVSAARNRGIEHSDAKYVSFLDADDVWFPEFLETMVGLAKKNEHCIAVASNYILRRADKDVVAHKEVALNGDIVVNYFSSWLDYKAHLFNGSCILVKREVLVDVGMFPVGVDRGEDLIAWICLAWTGDIAYCPKPLMAYYLENAGAVHKQRLTSLESYPIADVFKRWNRESRIPSHLLPSSIDFVVAHFLYFNKLLCNQGAYGPALRMLLTDIGFLKYRKRAISRRLLFVMYNWMKTSIKKSK